MATKSSIKEMFENAVHVGHRTQKWNPRMKKYLFGEKSGVHVINLEHTVTMLEDALQFLSKLSKEGKKVLFISTKPQSLKLVEEAAKSANMPYVVSRWIPGLLTNFKTIKARVKYLTDLEEQEASGEFEKFTKKEANTLKKQIVKLKASLGGVQNLSDLPDAVFVVDVVRDKIAVQESIKMKIPVVALVDSNADPSGIAYPIPANDDALKSLSYMTEKVSSACK
ncbi:30S ribosomal protein S2 [Candidatus Peregrinibacteria bacterium HGW-Peregrinibacteria-1]|jgi:small subunit ribosomal protein S2|nr:MAG: 30S ribosomal protein S2 [Candidatus Peregrinibacteria bacterium HGW-Peregrinibacteria-1]